jgi:50S ribosomal subunit-associated GTPase HflX
LEPLRAALLAEVQAQRPEVEVRVAPGDGKRLAQIYRLADVVSSREEDDGAMVLTVRGDREVMGRLGEG